MLQQLGDSYADVLTEYRRLLRTAIEESNGQEVDTGGDDWFAVFSRARDALAAAVGAQRAIAGHVWPQGISLRVRMGLHTGEARAVGTEYVGMDVHVAARICSAGHGGQVLLSRAVRVLIEQHLPEGVSLQDLGEHRLKDFVYPTHVYQVVIADLPAKFPPLRSLRILPSNLPRQVTSFIDREKEIAAVKRLLSATSLVALTGSGGAGKTRLAIQVAADLLDHYPDGVWFAEFAALSDPGLVPKEVASSLSIPEQPGRSSTWTLVEALRPKSLLLIFDNCEHLLTSCAQLAEVLLGSCSGLRIMATSREPLGIRGEVVFRVPSLGVPDLTRLPPTERLMGYAAVQLFVDRAALSQPGFSITSNNAAAVAQVTHRLDGIPLAIELAASRVKALPMAVIAEKLDDRFQLLAGGSRVGLPRQQTLRAALDWSHDLLTDQERILFRRLSVYAGEFTLEATEEICKGEGLEENQILDLLAHLVDKSLVIFDGEDGQGRFRLLETIRQYSHDRLQESGEGDDVRRRHLEWYLALAEQAEPEVRGPAQVTWLDRIESEHDNFRAALQWCDSSGEGDRGLRLACALWWFWYVRGHHREGRQRLEAAMRTGVASPMLRARALRGVGYFAARRADFAAARSSFQDALAISRSLQDPSGIADALCGLGRAAFLQKDLEQAAAFFNEARRLYEAAEDKSGMSRVLNSLGYLAATKRDFVTARARYAESLALGLEVGNKWLVGYVTGNLGVVAFHEGAYAAAQSLHTDALVIWRDLKAKMGMIAGLEDMGLLAAAKGKSERAARLLAAAEGCLETFGLRLPVDSVNSNLDDYMLRVRAALGEEATAARLAEGRAMTLEQAVAYALMDEDT